MMRPSVLRSGALRLAMLFASVFVAGAILYVGAVHVAVLRYAHESVAAAIRNEIALMRGEDETRGRLALLRRLRGDNQAFYSLSDPGGARVAGDLPASADHLGWGSVAVASPETSSEPDRETTDAITYGQRLADGSLLVVGRSLYETGELVEWLDRTAVLTAGGIVVLALGGGWLVASAFLGRLDRVNRTIGRIMDGAFAERLPKIGMGAEFDRLADQLNAMLDRILSLMESHRQLSTTIAHDLRTPLTRVHQRLETVRGELTAAPARDAVDAVLAQLDDLLATFAALLRLGTIETGALRARFRPVAITDLLARIHAAYAPAAEDDGKPLSICLPSDTLVMPGDGELLTQLFTNLIENALLHTGRGTRIAIEVRAEGGIIVCDVADEGPGVPETERQNVFRRFYRLSQEGQVGGAGLGLALVKAIVTLHGGRVALLDNAPGLRVRVSLLKEAQPLPVLKSTKI